jgi:hypothetical protein
MTAALSGPAGVTPASAAAVCRLSVCVDAHAEAAVRNLKTRADAARKRDAPVERQRANKEVMEADKENNIKANMLKDGAKTRLLDLVSKQPEQQLTFPAVKKSPVSGYFKGWGHARSHDLRLRTAKFGQEEIPRPVLEWRKVGNTGTWYWRPLALAGGIRGVGECNVLRNNGWGAPASRAMSLPAANPCGPAALPEGRRCECIAIMRSNRLPQAARSSAAHALALRLSFVSSSEEERFVKAVKMLLQDYDTAMAPPKPRRDLLAAV